VSAELCPDCLRPLTQCECPRCRVCGELEDYCTGPIDCDDDSGDLEDKEDA